MALAALTPSTGGAPETMLAVGTAAGLKYYPTDCDGEDSLHFYPHALYSHVFITPTLTVTSGCQAACGHVPVQCGPAHARNDGKRGAGLVRVIFVCVHGMRTRLLVWTGAHARNGGNCTHPTTSVLPAFLTNIHNVYRHAAAFIRVYRILDMGRRLELLHKTQVDSGPVSVRVTLRADTRALCWCSPCACKPTLRLQLNDGWIGPCVFVIVLYGALHVHSARR